MNENMIQKLANVQKAAEGEMPPGMMPQGQPMQGDPMAGGGMPMDMMGPPVPSAQEIMAMQQDPMAMGMPPGGDPGMMGMPAGDPGMAAMPEMPPGDPMAGMPVPDPGPSPEQLAVDQANAEALSAMGNAVKGLTDVLAKEQASVSDTIQNAANVAVASPISEELEPDDIGPLMEGDAV